MVPRRAEAVGIGIELRWMRQMAGLTGPALAESIGINTSLVSRLETGRRHLAVEKLLAWRAACHAAIVERLGDDTISVALHRRLTLAAEKVDSEEYRQLLLRLAENTATEVTSNELIYATGLQRRQQELARIEAEARRLRQFQPLVVPGILQTLETARLTMMTAGQGAKAADAAAAARVERAVAMLHTPSRTYHAVISQNALEAVLAGSTVRTRTDQLAGVLDASRYDHVTVQVLLRNTPLPRIPTGAFVIYDPANADSQHTVLVETDAAQVRFQSPDAIAEYEHAWEQLTQAALDPSASATWLEDAIHQPHQ